jgi:ubiquinone/menaquinone biosynthesis C-methylase UbiE
MEQREVWENIAQEWNKFRTMPKDEALTFLKSKKGLILDLGCANGRNFTKVEGRIVGLDFSEKMTKYAKKRMASEKITGDVVVGIATDLPFADNTFDAVLFANTLPSIRYNKHRKVMNEIKRVCKNKAVVFVSVWNRDQPRFTKSPQECFIAWRGQERYYYLYSKDDLKALMSKYFSSVKVSGSRDKAFGKFSRNIIATGKVKK